MSSITTATQQNALQTEQLRIQDKLQADQLAANNAARQADNNSSESPSAPADKDPDSYRLAFQMAIAQGRSPDAAAKQAYKNAAPRVNTEEKSSTGRTEEPVRREPQVRLAGGDKDTMSRAADNKVSEPKILARQDTSPLGGIDEPKGPAATDAPRLPTFSESQAPAAPKKGEAAPAAAGHEAAATAPGREPPRTASQAAAAPTQGREPARGASQSAPAAAEQPAAPARLPARPLAGQDGLDVAPRPVVTQSRLAVAPGATLDDSVTAPNVEPAVDNQSKAEVSNVAFTPVSRAAKDPNEIYNTIMAASEALPADAEGKLTPETAEAITTNVAADLSPDGTGKIQAGTVGSIEMKDLHARYAEASPEERADVVATMKALQTNPAIANALAAANPDDQNAINNIIMKGVIDGVLGNLTPKDAEGRAVSSALGGGAGAGTRKLKPMEMVMVAMMEAAIEGQNSAAALADEVSANTASKKDLRGEKTRINDELRAQNATPTGSQTTGDNPTNVSQAVKDLQKEYDHADTALSAAGDDSSILMIKLQTAAQIVTTFLQACSNVSKGVTDTTKAVIGNIGH